MIEQNPAYLFQCGTYYSPVAMLTYQKARISLPNTRGTCGEGYLVFQFNAEHAAKNVQLLDSRGFTPSYKHSTLPGLCLKDIFCELQKPMRVHRTNYACKR